jgi:hypothetical protein
MYVEWQIGYDLELNSNNIQNSTFYNSSKSFVAYNGKRKILYELSEYFYYFYKMGVFTDNDIDSLLKYLTKIDENSFIENLYTITKSYPKEVKINNMNFLESFISYPHLIYDFNNGFLIIAEITIKEKQRAVGIQPMLYLCFPITYLKDINGKSIIGRKANQNEIALFEFNEKNAFIIKESFKIFGIMSKSHNYDTIQILKLISQI